MAVNRAAALLQVNAHRLWRVYNHHVGAARAKESFAQVRKIGVDETAAKRGHDYITTVHDLEAERLLFATPGQDQTTLAAFKADFIAHGGDPAAISDIAMDMSAAYQAGAREHFPQAEVGFDRFHIVALASTALEQVRREEAKTEPLLKGSRWAWLKRPANWTSSQVDQVHHLSRLGLRTARAWRMCLTLRQIYATTASPEAAGPQIERWIAWARRSRLEPFKRLAQTLKTHFRGVIHGFSAGVHNGRVEAMNRALQEARARARGYRNVKNFICIAYLIAGKLTHLPRSPFAGAMTSHLSARSVIGSTGADFKYWRLTNSN